MNRMSIIFVVLSLLIVPPNTGFGGDALNLGPEEIVQAAGIDIDVGTYSVPSFVDWDNDLLKDLVIGGGDGKVRVYLNIGTESNPQFSSYFYAQSNGSDLYCPPSGCMGCFPRVFYWDGDAKKDLLVGQADGTVKIFLNIGTDESPTFDAGTLLTVSGGAYLDVGDRATPCVVDWDNDYKTDLVVGGLDGKIHLYINCGCGSVIPPTFNTSPTGGVPVQEGASDLVVPSLRSSPVVLDVDGDGKKDLLLGNTNGELLFYRNGGTDAAPAFSGHTRIESNGIPIDLPGTPRSRPSVCYWTGDGHFGPTDAYLDVLIGVYDGKVHLYQGKHETGDIDGDGDVDFADFGLFAAQWQQTSCGDCGGADFTDDGNVTMEDLEKFIENWLLGV